MSTFDEAYYNARAEEEQEMNLDTFERAQTLEGLHRILYGWQGPKRGPKPFLLPRVHGNGFIQLDLWSPRVRLHVWGPGIPRQSVPTPIHDHTFGFQSFTIRGCLLNVRYSVMPSGVGFESHHVYRARIRAGEDTVLVRDRGRGYLLMPEEALVVRAGCGYSEKPGDIHQSIADCRTATVILKDNLTLAQGGASPRVFVPVGTEPDNSFRRDAFPASLLWNIIGEVFR